MSFYSQKYALQPDVMGGVIDRVLATPTETWDDLRFPSTGLSIGGITTPPVASPDTGLYVFGDNVIHTAGGLAQMPHTWVEGTSVYPHVHWVQPAAGNVQWHLQYRRMPAVNGVFPGTWTDMFADEAVSTYPGSGDWVNITAFGAIDMTGYKISAMILFRIARRGDLTATDTLVGDVPLLEFDIHYLKNYGSRQEFIK